MPASVNVTDPAGPAVTTRRPTIAWGVDFYYWHVYVFPAASWEVHFNPSDTGYMYPGFGFMDFNDGVTTWMVNDWVYEYPTAGEFWAAPGSGHVPLADLPIGVPLIAVAILGHGSGPYLAEWGSSAEFTFDDTLAVPTGLIPAAASTVNTNLPTLQATLVGTTYGAPQKAEWQLATDAGFTANLRTITEDDVMLRAAGVATLVVPDADALFTSASWRARVRARNAGGNTSSWSAANAFTVAHVPTAAMTSPANASKAPWDAGNLTAGWLFSSTSPDMAQTAYQLKIERTDTNATVFDSGKVTSTDNFVTATGLSSALKGVELRVKVRLYDTEDVVSAYATPVLVTLYDAPSVTVTAPTTTQATPAPTVTWSYTPSDGGPQSRYRIVVTLASDGSTVYDSTWQSGDDTTFTLPATSGLTSPEDYVVTVTVRDVFGLEASDTQTFDTLWVAPDAPTFTIEASTYDDAGPVTALIDASSPDTNFAGWRLYWRLAGSTTWEQIGDTIIDGHAAIRVAHYTARANLANEYAVVQVADRFGLQVESDYNAQSITPVGRAYWLIGDAPTFVAGDLPADVPVADLATADSIRVELVTADPVTPRNLERSELRILGRGVKVETGTDYGTTGTLAFPLLSEDGGDSAYAQGLAIEALLDGNIILRKPSGKVATVNPHDVTFDPQGQDDTVLVSMPYTETA